MMHLTVKNCDIRACFLTNFQIKVIKLLPVMFLLIFSAMYFIHSCWLGVVGGVGGPFGLWLEQSLEVSPSLRVPGEPPLIQVLLLNIIPGVMLLFSDDPPFALFSGFLRLG